MGKFKVTNVGDAYRRGGEQFSPRRLELPRDFYSEGQTGNTAKASMLVKTRQYQGMLESSCAIMKVQDQ